MWIHLHFVPQHIQHQPRRVLRSAFPLVEIAAILDLLVDLDLNGSIPLVIFIL